MAKKVLVVEDDSAISTILHDNLIKAGYVAQVAKNGKEGVEQALKTHPDIILLDLKMPVMDGMTALGLIRKDEWGKYVPVIVLTNISADTEEMVESMVTYKPQYYLIKSDWDIKDIITKVGEEIKFAEERLAAREKSKGKIMKDSNTDKEEENVA
ncbi:MAG: response regulator [Candidatus Dojkabacteria bacterium]